MLSEISKQGEPAVILTSDLISQLAVNVHPCTCHLSLQQEESIEDQVRLILLVTHSQSQIELLLDLRIGWFPLLPDSSTSTNLLAISTFPPLSTSLLLLLLDTSVPLSHLLISVSPTPYLTVLTTTSNRLLTSSMSGAGNHSLGSAWL